MNYLVKLENIEEKTVLQKYSKDIIPGYNNEFPYYVKIENKKVKSWDSDLKYLKAAYPSYELVSLNEYINKYYGNIEIKPGMLIYTDYAPVNENNFYVVFPIGERLAGINYAKSYSWDYLSSLNITALRDICLGTALTSGKLLWEKKKEVELTMDEIAAKFNIPVEQLKIKK